MLDATHYDASPEPPKTNPQAPNQAQRNNDSNVMDWQLHVGAAATDNASEHSSTSSTASHIGSNLGWDKLWGPKSKGTSEASSEVGSLISKSSRASRASKASKVSRASKASKVSKASNFSRVSKSPAFPLRQPPHVPRTTPHLVVASSQSLLNDRPSTVSSLAKQPTSWETETPGTETADVASSSSPRSSANSPRSDLESPPTNSRAGHTRASTSHEGSHRSRSDSDSVAQDAHPSTAPATTAATHVATKDLLPKLAIQENWRVDDDNDEDEDDDGLASRTDASPQSPDSSLANSSRISRKEPSPTGSMASRGTKLGVSSSVLQDVSLLMAERERRDKWENEGSPRHDDADASVFSNSSTAFSQSSSHVSGVSGRSGSTRRYGGSTFEPAFEGLAEERGGERDKAISNKMRIEELHEERNSDEGRSVASSGAPVLPQHANADKRRTRLDELRKAHLLSKGKSSDLKGWFDGFFEDEQADEAAVEEALESEQQLMQMIKSAPWAVNGKMSTMVNLLLKNQSAVLDIKQFLQSKADPNHFSNLHTKRPLKAPGNVVFREVCVKKGVVSDQLNTAYDSEMTEELKRILASFHEKTPASHYWREETRLWLQKQSKHLPASLSAEQLKDWNNLFQAIDTDKGGTLDINELAIGLQVSGFAEQAMQTAEALFDKLDLAHDDGISLSSFVSMFRVLNQQKAQEDMNKALLARRQRKPTGKPKERKGQKARQSVGPSSATQQSGKHRRQHKRPEAFQNDQIVSIGAGTGVSNAIRAYQREKLLAEVAENL